MPPATADWLHLSDDEAIVWDRRPHPIAMGAGLPIGVGLLFVGLVLAGWSLANGVDYLPAVGTVIALGGLAIVGARWLVWTNTRYVITSDELYKKRGVVSRDVTQFRLDRVQNTSLQQSALGRLLGYGDLTVYTAGSGEPELTFELVPNPGRAANVLDDQLGATTGNPPV
ncbi:PH domain-containing protein [Halosolutus gelatinilyticus]|uniref:PH domain-containing protein n=1 Tax=Halosolutus gelatinilyticus TaxID=2931975 RepID=UPI001FF3495F|nr:PH domain-containing protein [Halosolutus gelatinilyticus]